MILKVIFIFKVFFKKLEFSLSNESAFSCPSPMTGLGTDSLGQRDTAGMTLRKGFSILRDPQGVMVLSPPRLGSARGKFWKLLQPFTKQEGTRLRIKINTQEETQETLLTNLISQPLFWDSCNVS